VHGENVLLAEERRKTPFPLHAIGTTGEVDGGNPRPTQCGKSLLESLIRQENSRSDKR
jgi:hypothetical protein